MKIINNIFKKDRNFSTFIDGSNTTHSINSNSQRTNVTRKQYEINKEVEQLNFYKEQINKYTKYTCEESKLKVQEYKKLKKKQIKKLKSLEQTNNKSKLTRILEILIK